MASYLVTGGAGFIGSHLVRELVGQGHDVVAHPQGIRAQGRRGIVVEARLPGRIEEFGQPQPRARGHHGVEGGQVRPPPQEACAVGQPVVQVCEDRVAANRLHNRRLLIMD